MSRIVTIWQFGRDSLTEYTGERFETSCGDGLKVFRVHSKEFRNKKDENKRTGKQYSRYCCLIPPSPPLLPVCSVKPYFLAGGMGFNRALYCCSKTVFSFPFVTFGIVVFVNDPKIIISADTVPCVVEFYFARYAIK